MEYAVICAASLIASGLTLFSGFGLGTLLMPVFALFFPVNVAVALTALVHFLNNLFKLALLGKHADRAAVVRFGFPAIGSAFLGAWTLLWLSAMEPLFRYDMGGRTFSVEPVKLVVSFLMVLFALTEVMPWGKKVSFEAKYLPLGGLLSGFFGGLTGHQGALRSAFLIRYGLSKETFIATGVVIACLVDFTRLSVYGTHLASFGSGNRPLLAAATLFAFLGAFLGKFLLKKVTLHGVQMVVAAMLFVIALALGAGLI
ncbi:MAG: sulfite exporter TauE/SafE family protein [Alphaproteobacteria bacterium]|uniref:Probable membrane transporter protein n=1 Tax=Candidatus Nitrobium versatile TaxID=2884831 RepID=A0A953J8T3_9BACT|nr:sulfite exporter TauE/SafE family protein [Candidatus Nitrobium versatile]